MRSVLVLAAILAAGSVLEAQTPQRRPRARASATLAVVVTDPAGAPVPNVLVTVQGAAERTARTEGGRIAFENLPAGSYRLRFEHEGFVTLERELTARAGAPVDVKVTLTPAPEPPPPPQPAAPPAPAPVDVKPTVLDLPSEIERGYVGRAPSKFSQLACGADSVATLIQLNQPLADQVHAEADEFLYVVAGEGTARTGGREERLSAGVFLLIPRGAPHTLTVTGKNPLIVLSTRAGERCAR